MTINYVQQPFVESYMLFADFKKQAAKEAKEVGVKIHSQTKTRIGFSFLYGETSAGVNIIPEGSAGFKFHTEEKMNYFSGNRSTVSYFIINKKQGIAAIETHVKNIVSYVFDLPITDEFTINVYNNNLVQQLRGAA